MSTFPTPKVVRIGPTQAQATSAGYSVRYKCNGTSCSGTVTTTTSAMTTHQNTHSNPKPGYRLIYIRA